MGISGLTGWRVLDREEVARLAAHLAALPAPLTAYAAEEAVRQLGWPVVAGPSFGGAVLRTGLAPYDGFADLRFTESGATAVVVRVTDPAREPAAPATSFRRDAFALAVAVVRELLGPPDERQPGGSPLVSWSVPAGRLRLTDDGAFVELTLLSPDYPTGHLTDPESDDFDDVAPGADR
ncbi:DUF6301 family protein [Micromonospora echinofusca]|uniref:SUKH-3 immunity protein n=1 Tax=Micromonospora echinofusca TaxID=47858 RepID=A0ABS3VVS4_MICEH|nr:DUF6301 family protein [Micromonospora echinofusca]MBO4208613.1 hypothetical protein [Micromonospora echinofusca]